MTIHRFIPIITLTLLISACTTSLDVTPVTTAIVVPPVEVQVIKTQEVGDEAQDGGYREEERPAQETAAANEEAQTRQSTWRGEIVELNIGGVIDEFRSSTGVELAGSEVAIFGIKTGAEESAVIYAPGEMLFWHKFNGIWERLSLELNSERDVVGINDEGEVVMKIPGWSKYLAMSSGEKTLGGMELFLATSEGQTRRIIVPINPEHGGLKALLLLAPVEVPQSVDIDWNNFGEENYLYVYAGGGKYEPLKWGVIDSMAIPELEKLGRERWPGVVYKFINFAVTDPAVYDEVNQVVSIPGAFPNVNGEEVRFTIQMYPFSHLNTHGSYVVGPMRHVKSIGDRYSITSKADNSFSDLEIFLTRINNKLGVQMMLVVAVDADGGMESTKAAMESQLQELRGNCLDSSWVGYSDCPALIERHERFMGEFESNFSSLQSLLWGRVLDGELIVPWLNLFLIPVD